MPSSAAACCAHTNAAVLIAIPKTARVFCIETLRCNNISLLNSRAMGACNRDAEKLHLNNFAIDNHS
jgi:hypothetical protein